MAWAVAEPGPWAEVHSRATGGTAIYRSSLKQGSVLGQLGGPPWGAPSGRPPGGPAGVPGGLRMVWASVVLSVICRVGGVVIACLADPPLPQVGVHPEATGRDGRR